MKNSKKEGKKGKEVIKVTKSEMRKEHVPLIRVLEHGTKSEQMKEAKKQKHELMTEYMD